MFLVRTVHSRSVNIQEFHLVGRSKSLHESFSLMFTLRTTSVPSPPHLSVSQPSSTRYKIFSLPTNSESFGFGLLVYCFGPSKVTLGSTVVENFSGVAIGSIY